MQVFHNDPEVAAKYISRIENHIAADNLLQGLGWLRGKGCAVGCTLEAYDHTQYPIQLGIPEWLAHVEDVLFEGMSVKKSRDWPLVFLKSCAKVIGADLEQIKAPFLIEVLKSVLTTLDHGEIPSAKKAVEYAIKFWQRPGVKRIAQAEKGLATWAAFSKKFDAEVDAWWEKSKGTVSKDRPTMWAEVAGNSAMWAWEAVARDGDAPASALQCAVLALGKVGADIRCAQYDFFADRLIELIEGAKL